MVETNTYSPDEFTAFLEENPIQMYDRSTGICWFDEKEGRSRCTDRVSMHNHEVGGPDAVVVVVADSPAEAVRALGSVRPR